MEEIEVPTEHLQEEIHHAAEHSRDRMTTGIAFSSAIIAALAAVSALLSGHHANEAMLDQIHASDQWNFYQAKSIKATILSRAEHPSEADLKKIEEYKKEQEEIRHEAEEKTKDSLRHLQIHETLAAGVTLFQVAISIGAIAALTRRKKFWWASLGFTGFGVWFLIRAFFLH